MKNKYIIIVLLIITGIFSSCDKFLEVTPKGLVIPETLADYESMLNSPTLTKTFPINLLDFTDDVFNDLDELSEIPKANGYYWRSIITVNEKASPDIWGPLYRCIYDANVIISGVPDASEGTAEEKQQLVAEALVIRANCYLDLLTVFAKAYDPATAATDPGLPMVTSISVTDKAPGRSSLQATLDAIISDITIAINSLPETNINRYRLTKYAAYGLLSRIYLYMADYANAKTYTNMALEATHSILDYNSYNNSNEVPKYELNPEVLWQRASVSGSAGGMIYSDDLHSYFDTTDIRYSFLTTTSNNSLSRFSFPGVYNFGITFPEMYLTKAELLARENKFGDAMDIVNMLRQNRIKADSYTYQTATSGEEALIKVLNERRIELAFSGLRWFDMKRLDQEGRMPEVRRIDVETMEIEATLPPHSPKYTFEIPVRVQMFNPDMELNHP